jgi:hypothetical protein
MSTDIEAAAENIKCLDIPAEAATDPSQRPTTAKTEPQSPSSNPTTPTVTDGLGTTTPPSSLESPNDNTHPGAATTPIAFQLFNGTARFLPADEYACWLGSDEKLQHKTRMEYMALFDFESKSILDALRTLCDKLYMKGESQQLNRVIESFSQAWVDQNSNHGFNDANVVYTIAYAILLLNTDLYAADHTNSKKISKAIFVQNTLETIRAQRQSVAKTTRRSSISEGGHRTLSMYQNVNLALVNECPVEPMTREWEFQIEGIVRFFYTSVSKEALKLHILENSPFNPGSGIFSNQLPTASTPSINSTLGLGINSSSGILGRMSLSRLRHNRQFENQSRITVQDRSADGFRRDSLGSTFSFETNQSSFGLRSHAMGFAGLLWNSMIKEEQASTVEAGDDDFADFSKIQKELEDELRLQLEGPPWVKEGLLQYRPYIDPTTGKKPRKKDWLNVFVVIQHGQIKLFQFDTNKTAISPVSGAVVGSGNWMDQAQLVDGFHLCHAMAQELPPSKKSLGYTAVWSLTLPQRGLLVFQAGTSDVAKEFVYSCNYWAGRLSKEPFDEPVSNMEYGWGFVNQEDEIPAARTLSLSSSVGDMRRGGPMKNRLAGDRLMIKEWRPSGHSMVVSDLDEERQLKSIKEYIERAENDLSHHNALRAKMVQAFTPSTVTWTRAHTNWEAKSRYLLQQVIRYKTYEEYLSRAIKDRLDRFPAEKDAGSGNASFLSEDTAAGLHKANSLNEKASTLVLKSDQVVGGLR